MHNDSQIDFRKTLLFLHNIVYRYLLHVRVPQFAQKDTAPTLIRFYNLLNAPHPFYSGIDINDLQIIIIYFPYKYKF